LLEADGWVHSPRREEDGSTLYSRGGRAEWAPGRSRTTWPTLATCAPGWSASRRS